MRVLSRLNALGQEVLDKMPMAKPVRIRKISETDKFRSIVQGMLSDHAADRGVETFEEANDFDIDEDPFPQSRFELTVAEEIAFNDFVQRSIAAKAGAPVLTDRHLPEGIVLRHNAEASEPAPVPGPSPAPVPAPAAVALAPEK